MATVQQSIADALKAVKKSKGQTEKALTARRIKRKKRLTNI